MASSDRPPSCDNPVKKKKTRELPNLSDCHACKRRTNTTNPSDRIRILTSHWRLVLLCKDCYNSVESTKLCSYCLTALPAAEDSGADWRGSIHQCRRCHRRVHRDCVARYSGSAPFSFLPPAEGLGSHDFSLCIDCWAPTSQGNGRVTLSKNKAKAMAKAKVRSDSQSPGISRVSDSHDKTKSSEEMVNQINCPVQETALITDAAKEKVNGKLGSAIGHVGLANGSLDLNLLANRGEQSGKCSTSSDLVDCNDKRLAVHLHRVMNSSPRITKSLHLSSKSSKSSTKVLKVNEDSSAGKLFRCLDHNLNTLESQPVGGACSSKPLDVGYEGIIANQESGSCQCKGEVTCSLIQNGSCGPEHSRFTKKYCRKASSDFKHKDV